MSVFFGRGESDAPYDEDEHQWSEDVAHYNHRYTDATTKERHCVGISITNCWLGYYTKVKAGHIVFKQRVDGTE
jgi:hypothetical protein